MEPETETSAAPRPAAVARRLQILEAAREVFVRKGFAGASIRDIARGAGVTEGLIYHYFESKEELEKACWREYSWQAHLERILAKSEDVPLQQVLRNLMEDLLQTMYENGPHIRMCAAEMQRNPEVAAYHIERIEENHRLFCDFLVARQQAGEIRPDANVDVAAGLLMGCAHSSFLLWGARPREEWDQVARLIEESGVDIILNGITPQGGRE